MKDSGSKPSALTVAGWIASGVGVATWLVYLVLRYAMHRNVTELLWVAFGLVIAGFAIRRSQG